MELSQAIDLIRHPGLSGQRSSVWADLGCGTGLFTYALANLLANGSVIYAIDKLEAVLSQRPKPDDIVIEQQQLDFVTQDLKLSGLDGILMANSLHYVRDKTTCVGQLRKCLQENGGFLLVEYNTDIPNPWVPYPVSFASLKPLFETVGFMSVIWLSERPSSYGRANMYAAYISKSSTPTE